MRDTSPQAAFAPSTFDSQTGESVSFDASASTDAEGPVSSYRWEFGDGSTANGPTQTHTYTSGGIYTVRLTVTDGNGNTDVREKNINISVPNTPPTAAFASSADRQAGTVTLDASASEDDDGTVTQYVWTLEDGTVVTGEQVTYDTQGLGSRDIELLVVDDEGSSATVTETGNTADEKRAKTTATNTEAPTSTDEQTGTVTVPPSEESGEGILDALGNLLRSIVDAFG